MSDPVPSAVDLLGKLVAFDTTSRNSNLELIRSSPTISPDTASTRR